MSIPLVIGLIGLLLALIIGYNVIIQYRQRIEAIKQQELAKHIAIIDATEELIGNAHHLPYSKELLVCLNQRIVDALQQMSEASPNDRSLTQRIKNVTEQIAHLESSYSNADITPFKVPSTDKQAIGMLQLVKRLKTVIKSEHSKGRMGTQAFVNENARLESIQLRINIENVVKRANEARIKGQIGTAKQLLKKGIDVLSAKNDNYANQAREKLQLMLDEIDNKQSMNYEQERQQQLDKDQDDLDVLFQPKRKW
ncbi:DNA repair protein [Photobacterium lucens]|uniref:DNA repair protein n=1 Tax=Photobacterium lucens TaxID=2562949 RepID=UPI000D16128A|nr:DNA repair protein [Photobacterium lucens]MBP2700620.1 DNA repair protein [Vibrio parahaemolyticus]MZG58083.1 DNA repair protein [Photobacterium lucens]MZG80708.1 DNA repair protein [Photobacterium lucens]PSV23560.1 DNA repair protein [Photobacterium leiognathi subsp. mandapamensis]